MNTKKLSLILFVIILIIAISVFFILSKQSKHSVSTISAPNSTPIVVQSMNRMIANFPDFPIYENSIITSSQITKNSVTAPGLYQVYLSSNDSVDKIVNWYTQNLQSEGWIIERAANPAAQPTDQNIVVKRNTQEATVNIEEEGDEGTTISIFIFNQ